MVSPFNTINKFLNNDYFLTNHQEKIKKEIIEKINKSSARFVTISGAAGTGKTLLTYDIAKELMNSMNVLVVHCANLNNGQRSLNLGGWDIKPIKHFRDGFKDRVTDYDVIIVDESQRLKKEQLRSLGRTVTKLSKFCIFSYDQRQTLSSEELNRNIEQYLKGFKNENKFKLKNKIRSNKSVANFIMSLMSLRYKQREVENQESIELLYFSSEKDLKSYLSSKSGLNYKMLRLTPRRFNGTDSHSKYNSVSYDNSHEVIGQEFDNVGVIIDEHFDYEEGELIYFGSSYYSAQSMLFQNMTRTRKKLKLLFVNNERVFKEALLILNSKNKDKSSKL